MLHLATIIAVAERVECRSLMTKTTQPRELSGLRIVRDDERVRTMKRLPCAFADQWVSPQRLTSLTNLDESVDVGAFPTRNPEFQLRRALSQPLHSESRHLSRILELEFFLDVGAMGLNGFWTDTKRFGNFADFVSFSNKLENFKFTIGQQADGILGQRSLCFRTAVVVELAGDHRAEVLFPAERFA